MDTTVTVTVTETATKTYPWERAYAECVRAKAEHPSYASGIRLAAWALKDVLVDTRALPGVDYLIRFIEDCDRCARETAARGESYHATLNAEAAQFARACLARWFGRRPCPTCRTQLAADGHCPQCAPILTRRDPCMCDPDAHEPAYGTVREAWMQAHYERVLGRMQRDLENGAFGVPDEEHGGLSVDAIGNAMWAELEEYERDLESRGCRFSSQERV